MIEKIAKEFGKKIIDCEKEDQYIKANGMRFYINASHLAGDEIILGLYKDKKKRLISFFHEIGHILIDDKFREDNEDPFLFELEASHRGIKFAKERGIEFPKKIKQWLYRQAISYIDYK